jgi:hypothetical protein
VPPLTPLSASLCRSLSRQLLRLIRLVRIVRIVRVIQRLEYSMHLQEGVRQLAGFLVILITITHWFSCLFYSLGEFDMMEDNTGIKCWANGHGLCGDNVFTNYVAACYWAIMTLTTVGYGDVGAQNNQQRILGIIAMICGALIFAYGVSQVRRRSTATTINTCLNSPAYPAAHPSVVRCAFDTPTRTTCRPNHLGRL